ncbi:MAG: thioredoxin family protein [Planctomycetes bacterium]|nr:thioredoxin family protein [Planctomycetota bacterium]
MSNDQQYQQSQGVEYGQFALVRVSSLVMTFLVVLALAVSGCQRAEQNAASLTALAGVQSKLLTQRGELLFVNEVEAGRDLATEKGLPCLLFFTADWCTYCHEMEETAFVDPEVAQMAGNFVCVLVDADREKEVCEQFSVSGYPTIQFVSSRGQVLNRLVGRQSASELVAGMRAALKRFAWLDDPATKLR